MRKEFPIKNFQLNGNVVTVSREDYESLPCAMKACDWTDEQMSELADDISVELSQYSFDETSPYYEDDKSDAFWKEMEDCAVRLGMTYYEDED